jgi:ABC-type nitrate/sulfonate/bicarbonate transport system substrate-binding protein
MPKRSARRLVVGVVLATGAWLGGTLISGCGGDEANTPAGAGGDSKAIPQLKVAVAVPNPLYALPYIAQLESFFKEEGVNVKIIDNTGSNTATTLASGQADIAQYAAGVPLVLSQQGKPAQIIYVFAGNVSGGTLVGAKGVKSIEQLKGKRIAVLAKGSATYGWANLWNQKFHLNADLVPFQDNASIQSALGSGRVAAAGGPYANFAALLSTGRANMLIDSRNPSERDKYAGPSAGTPEGVIFGLTDVLDKKRDAVVRFLKAMTKAEAYIKKASDSQLAKDLRTFSAFQTTPEPLLTDIVKNSRPYYNPGNSYMTEDQWKSALQQYGLWGLDGYKADDPAFAYKNLVDMSYYDEAGGTPPAAK